MPVKALVLQLDELQQAVKLLQAFTKDSQQYLQHLSERLGKRESLSGGVWKSRWGSLTGVNEHFPPRFSREDLPAAGELPCAQADRRPAAEEDAAAGGLSRGLAGGLRAALSVLLSIKAGGARFLPGSPALPPSKARREAGRRLVVNSFVAQMAPANRRSRNLAPSNGC